MIVGIQFFFILMILIGVSIILITKDIIHAVYALCLSLIGIASVYVILMSELLAVVQIMLYVGGVVILLIFGVMMTNRLRGEKVLSGSRNLFLGILLSLALFTSLVYFIVNTSFSVEGGLKQDQVNKIGIYFLTDHIVAFELIAFVLLVALVGATYLAKTATDE